ncbi:AfsR/SARP family transcriptional regulator [Actinoallomurus rhizosphaericola]|uniref:AfsR/SARP family transcriptional regulator n=1 Tax=Actinoallomurus rhizosphaericola TaxID=2952536 RepID=UPI0020926B4D|nr:BTAD domain-containing putative transcriptional regulator [Actinoallomurus rhizosphaericola]MCO5996374.1 tetratricopeptide repeat protein [Actinoallomurus rhizosphaericola]
MEIRILGPFELIDGERRVPIDAPKQRAVLTALVLRANRVVPTDELAALVWGDDPPASARLTLQGYVLRVRRALASVPGLAIRTEPAGYLLRVDPDRIDAHRFTRLLDDAARAAAGGDTAAEAELLREALALWRGEPLADVGSDALRREEAGRLAELRASAIERRVDADLRLGRHLELIGELTALVAAHPYREEFRAQLMLALYRAGRRADALEAYRNTRAVLSRELGIEPGPRLQRLEQAVLTADPDLDPAPRVEHSPCALPPDVPHFVGRQAELARLLAHPPTDAGPAVCAVAGMAGVGKTSLVVHAAHRLAERYPDGRIHVDLGGTTGHPMGPAVALDRFLRLLGVWGGRIKGGVDDRAALLRDRLAGRRVLLVLDNAVDEAQVRPLIPGTPGCAAFITSRARLIGLEYAELIDLDVLAPDEAVDLLAGVIGRQRTLAEQDRARTLVAQCGHLPLAVRIAAARLAGRPEWPLERLADQLADEHRRLDRLAAGDLEVRSSIALSQDALEPAHRRPFHLIGLLDLPEVTPWMVAALLDRPVAEAEDVIDALVDARLLDPGRADGPDGPHYRCHDLVRLFAREQALDSEPPEVRDAAVSRVLWALLDLAEAADDALPSRRLRLPDPRTPGPRQADPQQADPQQADPQQAEPRRADPRASGPDSSQAVLRFRASDPTAPAVAAPAEPLAWFEANRQTLTTAVHRAASAGAAEPSWRLAASLLSFLDLRGYWDDWRGTHEVALAAARACDDRWGETAMRYGLGLLATAQDRYRDAAAHLSAAVTGSRRLGAPVRAARALGALGDVHHICDRLDEAFSCFQEALEIADRHGDLTGRANGLLNLGLVHRDRGDPAAALAHLDRALTTFRSAGDEYGEAHVLRFLAATHYHSRTDLTAARRHATRAIGLFRRFGDGLAEMRSLRLLAMALTAEGHARAGADLLDRCLASFREQGDLFGEASTLWALGEAAHASGDTVRAVACLEQALALFRRLDVPLWEARTRTRLAAVRGEGADPADGSLPVTVTDAGPPRASSRGSG